MSAAVHWASAALRTHVAPGSLADGAAAFDLVALLWPDTAAQAAAYVTARRAADAGGGRVTFDVPAARWRALRAVWAERGLPEDVFDTRAIQAGDEAASLRLLTFLHVHASSAAREGRAAGAAWAGRRVAPAPADDAAPGDEAWASPPARTLDRPIPADDMLVGAVPLSLEEEGAGACGGNDAASTASTTTTTPPHAAAPPPRWVAALDDAEDGGDADARAILVSLAARLADVRALVLRVAAAAPAGRAAADGGAAILGLQFEVADALAALADADGGVGSG